MLRYPIIYIVIFIAFGTFNILSYAKETKVSKDRISVSGSSGTLGVGITASEGIRTPKALKSSSLGEATKGDWKIVADTMLSAVDSTVIEAKDSVRISNGVVTLRADYLRYFTETDWVYLRGNVILEFDDSITITADEAEINIESLMGWMYNGTIQMENPFVRITGNVVERKGANKYFFKDATVTSCDATVPAWKFFARLIDVRIDGYTVLYDSTLNLYNLPVINIPTAVLPSNVSRQTGFLFPDVSISSSKGVGIDIPFYWAIDKQNDLLITSNILSKKGIMLGGKYRGWYTPEQKVWLAGNWIYETNLENITSPVTQDTYSSQNNRYWIRGMFDTPIAKSRWNFQANIDYASDLSFMSDYKNNILGSNASFSESFDFFGREFNPIRQNRISEAVISTNYNRIGIAFSARYEEDLLSLNNSISKNDSIAVQTFPSAELFLYRQKVFDSVSFAKYIPLEVETDLGTSYFLRKTGTNGVRVNFNPKLYLPMQFDYISITPSIKVNQRAYFNTVEKGSLGSNLPSQEQMYIIVPEYAINMESSIAKAYSINMDTALAKAGESKWAGLMHTFTPWVNYTFRDYVDQSKTPEYTLNDRLEAINSLTYGFTTSLVRKRERLVASISEENTPQIRTETDYLRFLSLSIQQSYFPSIAHTEYTHNFSPVEMEVKYYYSNEISFRTFIKIDSIYGNVVRADVTGEYYLQKYRLAVGYDYQENAPQYYQPAKINSVYVEIETPVIYYFQGQVRYAHDVVRDKPSEISAELRYVDQCFSIGLSYYRDFFDTSFGLLFSIPNLL